MEPESESNVENTASLPIIKNSVVLPYQNSGELAFLWRAFHKLCVKEFIMAKTKFLALFVRSWLYYIKCVIMLAFTYYTNFEIPVIKYCSLLVKSHVFLWFGWLCQVGNKFHKKETWSGHYLCQPVYIIILRWITKLH